MGTRIGPAAATWGSTSCHGSREPRHGGILYGEVLDDVLNHSKEHQWHDEGARVDPEGEPGEGQVERQEDERVDHSEVHHCVCPTRSERATTAPCLS